MNRKFDYIDSDVKLTAFSDEIASSTWLAVDTEFMRERTYYAQLALIQIATDTVCALIDVPALSSLDPLVDAFTRQNCLKIMHSASQDLEVLSQSMGVMPTPLFDTQIAASFLGEADQIAYGAIVKQRIGVELDKDQTRTNWLQRPLTPAQLGYAELDVLYLYDLYQQLRDELIAENRLAWAEEESAALGDKTVLGSDISRAWTRLKSINRLMPKQQQVACALASWREERAQARDLPREWVLKKQAIIGLAKFQPASLNALHDIEGLQEKQIQRIGRTLLNQVAQATKQLPAEPLPLLAELSAAQRGRVKNLAARLREIGEAQHIAPALIANRNTLEKLVLGARDLPLLQGWRAEIAGKELLGLLES